MTINEYINRIDCFLELKPSEQIPYLGYYLLNYQKLESFSAKNIEECFREIHLPPYSNISSYLSREKKAKRMLTHKNGGYILTNNIPKAIGTNNSGSYPFFIAKYKNIHATSIIT